MAEEQITQFFLARHGESEWNRERRLQGRLNSPLTLAGLQQAEKLAELMQDKNIDLIISSPLGRAHQTAQACHARLNATWQTEERLQERHFGDWQSKIFDELNHHPEFEAVFFQVTDQSPPNGETGQACGLRISNTLREYAKTSNCRNILVVTHGDAIRCFMASLNQSSGCDAYSQYGNGAVFPVAFCHRNQYFSFNPLAAIV